MSQLLRLFKIYRILASYGLDRLLSHLSYAKLFRFTLLFTPWILLDPKRRAGTEEQRIKLALIALGPIFVKFGQMLSTRRDLLPDALADELAQLQDNVPAFDVKHVHTIIEEAFGDMASNLFLEFDDAPLASASIAQVHAAKLHDGKSVVVKVLRPDVEKTIRHDIAVMAMFANLAEKYSSEARRLHVIDVVKEYEKTIIDELDLIREAANGNQLRRNFENSDILYVPEMHWPLTAEKVIVMERIHGYPVTDLAKLKSEGVNLKLLAERGVEIFFSQVFRDNFFHADMHPGNIFVAPGKPENPQYMCVDFGIIGSLSPADQRYLGENLLAFFRRDYYRVAELHVESGWLKPGTRIDEFESAVRSACEPIFEKPLAEISFGTLLMRLFHISQRYGYEVQPQLVLLQKTLLNIEGLGRQLYPKLDLWETAQPFLEDWMRQQYGAADIVNNIKANATQWLGDIPDIPIVLKKLVTQISDGQLRVESHQIRFSENDESNPQNKKNRRAFFGASLILGALLTYALGEKLPGINGAPWASWFSGAIGCLLFIANERSS